MGLGRLEFGYPFKVFPVKERAPKNILPKQPAVQAPTATLVHGHGNILQPLPPRSRVVLIGDAESDSTRLDKRGLPEGSSVVVIIDHSFSHNNYQSPTAPKEDIQNSLAVVIPPKPKRLNTLRDTVRLRWQVFHPKFTEKCEFVFQDTDSIPSVQPKRRLSSEAAEHKSKRNRDDDVERSAWNEKYQTFSSDPYLKHQSPTLRSEIDLVPVRIESALIGGGVLSPILEEPASPPASPSAELPTTSLEFNPIEMDLNQRQNITMDGETNGMAPLANPGTENLKAKSSVASQLPASLSLIIEQSEGFDSTAPLPNGLPLLPLPDGTSVIITPPKAVDSCRIHPIVPSEIPVQEVTKQSTQTAVLNSPHLSAKNTENPEKTNHEEHRLLLASNNSTEAKPPSLSASPIAICQEFVTSDNEVSPPSTPSIQAADGENNLLKMVAYMPLTPPETPLAMAAGRERVIGFNMSIPLLMPSPPTPSTLMDSSGYFRGKDRVVDDYPEQYFAPVTHATASSSHSFIDSPLASRIRKIEGVIHEEEEGKTDEKDQTENELDFDQSDDGSDIEEIIRSPCSSQHMNYPSPPSSPIPRMSGKSLACISTTTPFSPSPPLYVQNTPINEVEEGAFRQASPPPFCLEGPISVKEKKSEVIQGFDDDEPYQSQDDPKVKQDDLYFSSDHHSAHPYGNTWATADDIFYSNYEQYQYTYQSDNRPLTPASSVGTLSRRWSAVSRMSYNTNITTPPQTRPGSAIGTHSPGNYKLLGWNDNDQSLNRSNSFSESVRRDLLRDQAVLRSRKLLLETGAEKPNRPALRWCLSMPLIREKWSIQYPLVVSPVEKSFVNSCDDYEEYEVEVPGQIQLLPLTRGVIVNPPRIESRRLQRPKNSAGPHRRKIKSLVQYLPDDQLEGIGELFEELNELSSVDDEILSVTRAAEVEPGKNAKVIEMGKQVEELKTKKASLLQRLKTRASSVKKKVKTNLKSSKADIKGKEKAVA